ncbi:facilitated trehalose transporter Tret1 [Procambarus clarkii]|uniref:facilitated trehalose transporter Tret1 n=1 Tax=Procambarus clarkii TaxID=6728 RepID=UPI003742C9C2
MNSQSTSTTSLAWSTGSNDSVDVAGKYYYTGDPDTVKYGTDKCKKNFEVDAKDQVQTEKTSERRRRLLEQALICFLASTGMWTMGSILAFPSVASQDLAADNTTIYGSSITLTRFQLDALGGLAALGSLPGSWVIGALMAVVGRRFSMVVIAVTAVLSWLGVALLPSLPGLLVARFVSGAAAGGASVCVNTYRAEISDAEWRGSLSVIINLGVQFGQLVTMAVGYHGRYFTVALVNNVIPLVLLLSVIWLPESPSFLIIKGRDVEARQVLLRLRGQYINLEKEMDAFKELNNAREKHSVWQGLRQSQVLKSIVIITVLFSLQSFTGYLVINSNASRIFAEAASSISNRLCAIIIIIIQIVAGFTAVFLLDTIGRKKSLILSFSTMLVALSCMAAFLWVKSTDAALGVAYGWVPLVCIMTSQAGVTLGVQPVPYLLMGEYFPTWIRSQATSICYSLSTLFAFASLQLYTPMLEGLTNPGLYLFYASICLLGIVFTTFFVSETMGKKIG